MSAQTTRLELESIESTLGVGSSLVLKSFANWPHTFTWATHAGWLQTQPETRNASPGRKTATPVEKCPFACQLEGTGMGFLDEWGKWISCWRCITWPKPGETPGEKDTIYLGCDSAKRLRLLLEQKKIKECL